MDLTSRELAILLAASYDKKSIYFSKEEITALRLRLWEEKQKQVREGFKKIS